MWTDALSQSDTQGSMAGNEPTGHLLEDIQWPEGDCDRSFSATVLFIICLGMSESERECEYELNYNRHQVQQKEQHTNRAHFVRICLVLDVSTPAIYGIIAIDWIMCR